MWTYYDVIDTVTGEKTMSHAKSCEIAKKYNRSQGTVNMSGRTGSLFCGRYKAVVAENNHVKDRNTEIARRVKAGEDLESIAKEYGFKSKYSVKYIDRMYNGSITEKRKKEEGFKRKKVNPNDTITINNEKYTVIKTYPYVVLACKRDRHGVMREYTFSYFEIEKARNPISFS